MAYHTAYRPRELEDVIGQAHIVAPLRNIIEGNRAHTFMFHGPSGCGKTTLARIVADMVGCVEPREVNAASNTGVDAARALEESTHFVSLHGGPHVIIMDECHRLSKQAWDVLLKPTEEPGQHVYWIFCTTEPEKVPTTIRTRCVSYAVRPASIYQLEELMQSMSQDNPPGVHRLCAQTSGGSPRQALVNLTAVHGLQDIDEVKQTLSRVASSRKAVDLAKMLLTTSFDMGNAKDILRDIADENPESIRLTMYHYILPAAMGKNTTWLNIVLSELEKPAIESNKIGDIYLRIARLYWKQPKPQ